MTLTFGNYEVMVLLVCISFILFVAGRKRHNYYLVLAAVLASGVGGILITDLQQAHWFYRVLYTLFLFVVPTSYLAIGLKPLRRRV